MEITKAEAVRQLTEWAISNHGRNALVRRANLAGVTKNEIHHLTGIARTTIDRILEPAMPTTLTPRETARRAMLAATETLGENPARQADATIVALGVLLTIGIQKRADGLGRDSASDIADFVAGAIDEVTEACASDPAERLRLSEQVWGALVVHADHNSGKHDRCTGPCRPGEHV